MSKFIELQFDAEAGKGATYTLSVVFTDPGAEGVCRAHECESASTQTRTVRQFGDVGLCDFHAQELDRFRIAIQP